eukprot:7104657-Prymnesium_polylepis.1
MQPSVRQSQGSSSTAPAGEPASSRRSSVTDPTQGPTLVVALREVSLQASGRYFLTLAATGC